MLHVSLNTYLQRIEKAFDNKDGESIASLFSFRDPHITNPHLQVESPELECQQWFSPPLDEMVAAHLRCCWSISNAHTLEAYNCQAIVLQAFLKIMQSQKEENWSLPVLNTLALDLRLIALKADIESRNERSGKFGLNLEKCAELLMSCFRVCASDNRALLGDSKKWGMMNLINQLFKIYFKINKLHLCKPLIRAIEGNPLKDKFPLSQVLTYKYYVGRKAIFDSDFLLADDYLNTAFQRCHVDSRSNKHMLLRYLLPVKMLLGYMPKEKLLRKYDLPQFLPIAASVKSGNLKALKDCLDHNEALFSQWGVYLVLEKLTIITYRNLIKKVALILKTHQLPIRAFTAAFKWMGEEDIDDAEVQCIIANLIYEDKIKGYISHPHNKLVVSKQNAFPPLNK